MTYTISNVSAASPDMDEAEFMAFVENIRQHGLLVPIWKSGDEIIDGRKRLRACEMLGIKPRFVDVTDGRAPEDLAYSLNILRTHWTPSQRAAFASRRATATPAEGPLRRDHPRGSNSDFFKTNKNSDIYKTTNKQAADEAGVHRQMVIDAKRIRREGATEVIAAVEAGILTLHAAKKIVASVATSEQPGAVQRVVESSRGKTRQTPARILGQTNGFRRSPRRSLTQHMERGLINLETAVEVLERFVEEDGRFLAIWTRRLRKARTKLSRVIVIATRRIV